MTRLAFECFGDQDIFHHLQLRCHLPLEPVHSYSQGEVIRDLSRGKADAGVVDEDPGKSHHGERDRMAVVSSDAGLEVRAARGRWLFILAPDLETCFFEAMQRVGEKPSCGKNPAELHRRLGTPGKSAHDLFRSDLERLRQAARARKLPVFLTLLEERLRALPTS